MKLEKQALFKLLLISLRRPQQHPTGTLLFLPPVPWCVMLFRSLLALAVFLGLALPVQAALTLGVAPDSSSQLRSESAASHLATQLQGLLGEEVRLRVFRSDAELNEWIQRYRVVDLALVSRGFYNQQPAGSLYLLVQPTDKDLVVARPGLTTETLARLRNAMPALESVISPPQPQRTLPAQRAPKTAPQKSRKKAQAAVPPGNEELQPGQEILAMPGQAPRITAQPERSVRRTPAKQQQPKTQPKVDKTKPTPAAATVAPAPKPSAAVVVEPAPAVVAASPAQTSAPTPSPTLVLPPPQPAPSVPPVTAPPISSPEPTAPPAPAPQAPPEAAVVPEVHTDSASPIPWLGILVLIGGFGYLFHRRRQKSRPIDWSAVNQKKPRPTPSATSKKPAPLPPKTPVEKDTSVPRGITASRVVLPPMRKAVEAAAAPVPEPVRVTEAIALAEETPTSSDSMAASLTEQESQIFAEDHQSVTLPPLDLEDQPALEVQIPPLELELELDLDNTPLGMTVESTSAPEPEASRSKPELEVTQELPAPVEKRTPKPANAPPLRGDIAAVNIPRLLEAAAAQSGPCILHIRGRHDEKRLHFRNGHLADAASVNRANRAKTGFLMNKVGYLLIRQGRITEEQRDQALRLCVERPKLRIGEALVELGALSRESLLEALQTQAEGVIFSLFIFPDGRYEIVADDADTPAANDLNIDLSALLSKAEGQEPEWERIRQAIPSLDTILDFPEGGRDKLDSARMTEHQKLVLSLINGQRAIRDICIAATMLDLEVYKFLFFMVNAKILTRTSEA